MITKDTLKLNCEDDATTFKKGWTYSILCHSTCVKEKGGVYLG
jgi:hypothetical protein